MLKSLSPRDRIEQLISVYQPRMNVAFMDAVDEIKSDVILVQVAEALEKGNVDAALRAMNIDEVVFQSLDNAIRDAYAGGGAAATHGMPELSDAQGTRVVVRFDMRNIFAENWLRTHSGTLIKDIVDDQRESVRKVLGDGLREGNNPTQTALDIVGRFDRATQRRTGGIIGLSRAQVDAVMNARSELMSGDPKLMSNYLTRNRRDARFDRTVMRAIAEGKPLTKEVATRLSSAYADRLLKLRGEMIARTETMAALGQSNIDAFRGAVRKGAVPVDVITKTWHATPDEHTRHSHRAMNGQTVGLEEKFKSPSGAMLEYPGDPKAPAREIVACRCWMQIKINHVEVARRRRL